MVCWSNTLLVSVRLNSLWKWPIKLPESERSPCTKGIQQSLWEWANFSLRFVRLIFPSFASSSTAVIFCVLPLPADHLLHLWPFVTKRAFLCLTAKEREGISFNRKVLYRFNNFESRKGPRTLAKARKCLLKLYFSQTYINKYIYCAKSMLFITLWAFLP